MLLSDLIDVKLLGRYIDDGIVRARPHPTLPLVILNYTPAAVTVKVWDETLSRCRGLVYDTETLQVVGLPMRKFWNFGDTGHGAGKESLPEGLPKIYEKIDGSLGIGFFYQDEFIIATRGSFESDQAKWANGQVEKNFTKPSTNFSKNYTYLFEIVAPGDRKVVNYPFSGLVLLGAISLFSGREYPPEDVFEAEREWMGWVRLPRQLPYEELEILRAKDLDNEEGFVATWYDGAKTYRVKLKFETYCKFHKLYFQTSTLVIWDLTRVGKSVIMELQDADQALKDWAGKIASDIQRDHDSLRTAYTEAFRTVIALCNISEGDVIDRERRKLFAMYAKGYEKSSLLFTLFDGRLDKFEDMVWEFVKPVSKQFFRKTESEEG